jgi:hypothetical protein
MFLILNEADSKKTDSKATEDPNATTDTTTEKPTSDDTEETPPVDSDIENSFGDTDPTTDTTATTTDVSTDMGVAKSDNLYEEKYKKYNNLTELSSIATKLSEKIESGINDIDKKKEILEEMENVKNHLKTLINRFDQLNDKIIDSLYIALKTKVETIAKMTKQSIDKIESK